MGIFKRKNFDTMQRLQMYAAANSGGDPKKLMMCMLWVMIGCAAMPIIISIAYTVVYGILAGQVGEYNDDVKKGLEASGVTTDDDRWYDLCGGTGVKVTSSASGINIEVPDTKWSVGIVINFINYLLHIIFNICLALTILWAPLGCCGFFGHCCAGILHLVAIILAGVFRYSDDGEKCAENATSLKPTFDWTFEDHGKTLEGAFISQAVFYCFYSCCVGFLMQVSWTIAYMKLVSKQGF